MDVAHGQVEEGSAMSPEDSVAGSQAIMDVLATPAFSVDAEYRYVTLNRAHAAVMKTLYGCDVAVGLSLLECMTIAADRATAKVNIDRTLSGESVTESVWFGDDPDGGTFVSLTARSMRTGT
jgi:hypothetical protein